MLNEQKEQENLIEIPETVSDTETINITEGMSLQEILEARELGLIPKEDGEDKDGSDEDAEKDDSSEDDEINTDPDNFEEMDSVLEKDEKKFHEKFSANQKALYFKQKAFKKKYQDSKSKIEELEKEIAELRDAKGSKGKIDKISELLGKEDLTKEEIDEIIKSKNEEVKEIDEKAGAQLIQQKVQTKAMFAEKIGNAKYSNFKEASELVEQMIQGDSVYKKVIVGAFHSDDVDEAELVETIMKIAKLSPKYNETFDKKSSVKIDNRAEINSKKKISSAAIGGSKRGRLISEDDITLEEAVLLQERDPAAFNKLSPKTIDRLLKQQG